MSSSSDAPAAVLSTDTENAVSDPQQLAELAAEGQRLYDERVRQKLEPEHNGKIIAIHLPTGDFAVARNSPEAMRALHARHPDGMIMTMPVGQHRDGG